MPETTAKPLGSGTLPAIATVYTPEELAQHEREYLDAVHGHMQAQLDEQRLRAEHQKASEAVGRLAKLIEKKKFDLAKIHK